MHGSNLERMVFVVRVEAAVHVVLSAVVVVVVVIHFSASVSAFFLVIVVCACPCGYSFGCLHLRKWL